MMNSQWTPVDVGAYGGEAGPSCVPLCARMNRFTLLLRVCHNLKQDKTRMDCVSYDSCHCEKEFLYRWNTERN